jgi:DNA-binding response OmpR family regulator
MRDDTDCGIAKADIHGVSLDFISMEARTPHGVDIHFTRKEWQMLLLLCGSAGEAISRDRFLDLVWGVNAFPSTRTVDNHIASIRAKLKSGSSHPDTECILTVHGHGYRLKPDSMKILQIHDNSPETNPQTDAHDKSTDTY